jgi:hypothetical protein
MKNKLKLKKLQLWIYDESIEESNSPGISPARNFIPDWYKNIPRFNNGGSKVKIYDNGALNLGLKYCTPFLDTLTTGYMVTLHCDILVEGIGKDKKISWTSVVPPIDGRPIETVGVIPLVTGYGNFTQAWKLMHGMLVPKGYSLLFTQPLNHTELNTFTTSGIVDADEGMPPGGMPFAIREDFEGIIKRGTPIIQIIPFKRDAWKIENLKTMPNSLTSWSPRNSIYGWYKQNIWKKKSFE